MVLPNEFGVRRHPLFIFDPLVNLFRKYTKKGSEFDVEKQPLLGDNNSTNTSNNNADEAHSPVQLTVPSYDATK